MTKYPHTHEIIWPAESLAEIKRLFRTAGWVIFIAGVEIGIAVGLSISLIV